MLKKILKKLKGMVAKDREMQAQQTHTSLSEQTYQLKYSKTIFHISCAMFRL